MAQFKLNQVDKLENGHWRTTMLIWSLEIIQP